MTCRPSEASSPESAASTSALSEPGGSADGKSSGTPTASTSSPTTGPMFPDMETSEVSMGRRPVLWPPPRTQMTRPVAVRPDGHHSNLESVVADPASHPLISSPAGSPASRGAWPGNNGDSPTIVGSGPSSSEPFANYDPATSSWRTSQGSWLDEEAWGLSSEDWPRSGMTRSGTAFRQVPSAPLTGATASGSWPTPTARDWKDGSYCENVPVNGLLGRAVWPTPRAQNGEPRNHTVWRRPDGEPQNLENAVAARDPELIGGALNPTWVEWLMGFPLGWTDCEHLAMPSFRKSLKSSGGG
jgi:hypothetical protein